MVASFVGGDRLKMVEQLVRAFHEVESSAKSLNGPSRLVALVAPTGEGKTRIIQEFYRRLAAEQVPPAYWPSEIVPRDADWMHGRKQVAVQSFSPEKGASLPWLYWSVSCQRRADGSYAQAIFDDVTQFSAHVEHLYDRLKARDVTERSFDATQALVSVLGALGVITMGPFGTVVVGLGALRALEANTDLVTRFKEWRARRAEVNSGEAFRNLESFGRDDELNELAQNVVKVSRKVPMILVIDDAHWADATLTTFVDTILRSSLGRVLVVATMWPDNGARGEEQGPFLRWLESTLEEPLNRTVEVWRLEPLAREDLAHLIRTAYDEVAHEEGPLLSNETVEILSSRFPSPLGVRAFFGLRAVRNAISHGGLTPMALSLLPPNLTSAYQDYLEELPEPLQRILTIAAVSGQRFASPPVVEAATLLGSAGAEDHLGSGRHPYGVLRELEEFLDSFADSALHESVLHRAPAEFADYEMEIIAGAVSDYAKSLNVTEVSRQLASTIFSTHLHLASEGYVELHYAAESAWKLARLSADAFNYEEAITVARTYFEWTCEEEVNEARLDRRHYVAIWLVESGRIDDALEEFRALLHDRLRFLGPDHPNTLSTRHNIASSLGRSGHIDEALEEFRALLHDRLRILGPDHPNTLFLRGNIARWLGESGRIDEALEELRAVLHAQFRVLGADHPDTLITRSNIASSLGRSGHIDEALEEFRALLHDLLRVLGADHPDTLSTRGNIASWLGESGKIDEVLEELRAVLHDRLRVLGADHPDTLITRSNIASSLGRSGHIDESLEEFRALLRDQLRVLGADHPETLTTRHNYVYWLGQSGRIDEALEEFRSLLDDRLRVLGADHPHTLITRGNIARWLGESGRIDEALGEFRDLLHDQLRILGPDHPYTLITRGNIAYWLGGSGEIDEALGEFRALLDDQLRVLGADHPDTLSTQYNIASWLGEIGRIDEALVQSRALLHVQVRVLGADHPDTLPTRPNIAQWLGESGRGNTNNDS